MDLHSSNSRGMLPFPLCCGDWNAEDSRSRIVKWDLGMYADQRRPVNLASTASVSGNKLFRRALDPSRVWFYKRQVITFSSFYMKRRVATSCLSSSLAV